MVWGVRDASGGCHFLPTAVGIGRNLRRWYKAQKLPPLQPGHEFDEWSDYQVPGRVTMLLWVLVVVSLFFFVSASLGPVFSAIWSNPESVVQVWHKFEAQCPPPPDLGD